MKKIYRFIFTAVALLSIIPLAFGDGEGTTTPQKGPDYYLNDDGSIGYMKSISEPNSDGVYYITLESFASGESVKISKSVPADIVLVLDMSGSMAFDMDGNEGTWMNPIPVADRRVTAMKNAVKAFIEQIDINDKYEKYVEEGSPENILRKNALGNRLAIVTFSSTATNVIGLTKLETGKQTLINRINGLTDNPSGGTQSDAGLTNAYNILEPLGDDRQLLTTVLFTDGDPGNGSYWEERSLNNLNSDGRSTWNTANAAISKANDIKNLADADKQIISKVYTISIQTDLSDYTKVYLGKTSSNYTGATRMSPRSTYDRNNNSVTWNSSDIWSNGNGTALPAADQRYSFSTTDAVQLKDLFETIASESGGGSEDLGEEAITEVDVVSASFTLPPNTTTSDIDVYIAKCIGMQEPKQYIDEDDGTTKTGTFLDFDTPVGPIDPENEVLSGYTYDKHVKNSDGTITIVDTPVDANIRIEFDKSGTDPNNPDKEDIINVNGFDYGGNWCGPRKNEQGETIGWHGYKVVVKIPVMMDPNAVGGADSPTNAEGSGIIVKGVNVAPFRSPKVSLPINIHIRKDGLDVGESAKFLIERKLLSDPETAWVEVSSVFVTRHKGQDIQGLNAPICKIVGMPSVDEDDNEFVYRVREANWNWSYALTEIKGPDGSGIGNLTTKSATSEELVTNPFIFVNRKIDDIDHIVRHAESKATNTFKTELDKNVEYDDSKNNGRPVKTVTNE